ncbi:MAG: CHASE3 domain-containing protein, partial [Acetobacteraceae bacterium]|nr:CHASE3 domain-containing protein [Acetobacteraceae bacterium]
LVTRANAILFFALLALLALIGGMTWERMLAARSARDWTDHSYRVLGAIKNLDLAVHEAESAERGYLLTGDEADLAPFQDEIGHIERQQRELSRLTADNPIQQERLSALAPLLQRKLSGLARAVQLRRAEGLSGALQGVRGDLDSDASRQMAEVIEGLTSEEARLLAQRSRTADSRRAWSLWLASLGTIVTLACLLVAARMLNRAWRRSQHAEDQQRALALHLRASLDSLSQGVAVFGPAHALTDWNDCLKVLLKLPATLLRAGTPYSAFCDHLAAVHGEAVLESAGEIRQSQGEDGGATIYDWIRRDGRHLELRRTPMPDGGFVLAISDFTRRAQAEHALRDAQKMHAVGQLTGGIAHDFNNLLTVILGNLEFLRTAPTDDPRWKERLERVTWAAQRGATLTRQLLAFARKQPLALAPVDLDATILQFLPLLRRTLGEEIEVRYAASAGLRCAMADAAQLESAVLNLALNARDAMPDGGCLTVALANEVFDADERPGADVTPGDYVMVAVSDTGHGMTPDTLAKIFEPFFTTKTDGRGTGLGLAMVFGFVKQSGGHITVCSEPGQGTTFRLYFPRAVTAARTDEVIMLGC